MILDFDNLCLKFHLKISGVIHIGAHIGQEYAMYKDHGITNIVMVEPQPGIFDYLKSVVGPEVVLINKALGAYNGTVKLNPSSTGTSTSVLKPKLHLTQHPDIIFTGQQIEVPISRLDDLGLDRTLYNFLNIDVQGYELEVLKGGTDHLQHVQYIISEVNRDEVYENCAKVEEVDKFLAGFGFRRVETNWEGVTWGDAFYYKL